MPFQRVLIVADIEGSSGCWNYAASSFMTTEWAIACAEMTKDVEAVVQALLRAGVTDIIVKDFHRTGYNLLPERIDRRARVDSGYALGPIPGMGDPGKTQAVLFLGLHAASGTDGFLPHTMTSRLAAVRANGALLSEVALFAALLAPYGIRPVFFSGCPDACRQAAAVIPGISTYSIDKQTGPEGFDAQAWRQGLAQALVTDLPGRERSVVRVHHHWLGVVVGERVIVAGLDNQVGNLRRCPCWCDAHTVLPQAEMAEDALDHSPVIDQRHDAHCSVRWQARTATLTRYASAVGW